MTPKQQPNPDYGEPWHEQTALMNQGVHWLNTEQFNRAVVCVNACAGMAEPGAEIQAMREAIEEVHTKLSYAVRLNAVNSIHVHVDSAIDKLQPFIQ